MVVCAALPRIVRRRQCAAAAAALASARVRGSTAKGESCGSRGAAMEGEGDPPEGP